MRRKRINEKKSKPRTPSGAAVMQKSVTQAIERAMFEEWAKVGYSAFTIEAVAKRAGVGKAAIYRRWPSKLAMVNDCVTRVGTDLITSPNTGNLHSDIRLMLEQLRRILRHPLVTRILPDLHAELPRTPELASHIRSAVQAQRRSSAETVLRNAMSRKELAADLDIDLALDALGSIIYWRIIVTKKRADNAYLDRLTAFIVKGLK
ncbi:TetR/AcrR family transcriptional regulator [Zooshikella sp. RANM57]|uniref:TetR/AcrR family transcriptional regulator n=1 Tax=Zooshikella sp. RANM57 TaxID=3425863 RepID=UPI003D6ED947